VNVIREWIEPGTTVTSDCWAAYSDIGSIGYTHRTVNHSVSYVNSDTGAHTNTVKAMWRTVKDFLRPYNRRADYHYHLAHYMFAAGCKALGVPQFNLVLAIFTSSHWANCGHSSYHRLSNLILSPSAPRDSPRFISRSRRHLGHLVCARTHITHLHFIPSSLIRVQIPYSMVIHVLVAAIFWSTLLRSIPYRIQDNFPSR
jgi:hypothetical protein